MTNKTPNDDNIDFRNPCATPQFITFKYAKLYRSIGKTQTKLANLFKCSFPRPGKVFEIGHSPIPKI